MWMVGFASRAEERRMRARGWRPRRVDPAALKAALGTAFTMAFGPASSYRLLAVRTDESLRGRLDELFEAREAKAEADRKGAMLGRRVAAADRLFDGAGRRKLGLSTLDDVESSDPWVPDGDMLLKTFWWGGSLLGRNRSTFAVEFLPGRSKVSGTHVNPW